MITENSKVYDLCIIKVWLWAFQKLWIMHTQRNDKEHFKNMITENSKVYDSIHESSEWKKRDFKS
jgi:hypothetical protein